MTLDMRGSLELLIKYEIKKGLVTIWVDKSRVMNKEYLFIIDL